jgi:type I restriction enzyme, S subunit
MSGRLPEGWTRGCLGDVVASISAGVSVNSEDRRCNADEIGVLKTSCVFTGTFRPDKHKAVIWSDTQRVSEPVEAKTVLVSRMNTPELVGASAYVPASSSHLFLPDRLWQVRAREGISSRWLGYVIGSSEIRARLKSIASGTSNSMKNISRDSFLELPTNIPPLFEQRRIVAVLYTWDRFIDITEHLVAAKRRRFHGLLMRLIGSYQGAAHVKGWLRAELGDLVDFKSGGTPDRDMPEFWGGSIPWISAKDLKAFDVSTSIDMLTEAGAAAVSVAPAGAILLLVRGMGLFRDIPLGVTSKPAAFNQDVKALVPKAVLCPRFLAYALRSRRAVMMDRVEHAGHGTGRISTDFLKALPIASPVWDEQTRIAAALDAADKDARLSNEGTERVRAQKRGLMQRLLTGEWTLGTGFDTEALASPAIAIAASR